VIKELEKFSLNYRPEIDGMRAIAVISVIIYHLKISIFDSKLLVGGYLGVDVFFVLSGFLITKILVIEYLKSGTMSIKNFYWRRTKRILPALFLVIIVTMAYSWFVLLPSDYNRLSQSILSALFFVSNFFWFFELNEYGAQSGLLQPFLHTWSLAIEEQYYLFFPFLLLVLFKLFNYRIVLYTIGCSILLGLMFAEILTQYHSSFSFFSPTSRAWELLSGSFLGLLNASKSKNKFLLNFAPKFSIAIIVYCFFTFSLNNHSHPGLSTLPIIFASCLFIYYSNSEEVVTKLFSSRPMVIIGKLSYSLYLWHFPIFAIARLTIIGEPKIYDFAIMVFVTIIFSCLGYVFVEKPFRRTSSRLRLIMPLSAAFFGISIFSVLNVSSIIEPKSIHSDLEKLYGFATVDNTVLAKDSWSLLDSVSPNESIASWNALVPSEHEKNDLWFGRKNSKKVLIIGDSHSKDLYNALVLNESDFSEFEFARFNIHRNSILSDLDLLFESPNFKHSDYIFIAPRYYREFKTSLVLLIEHLEPFGKKIVVFGNNAEFNSVGSLPLFDWYLRQKSSDDSLLALNELSKDFEVPFAESREAEIKRIALGKDVLFISRRNLVCRTDACTLVTELGKKTMYDDTHWTLGGAKIFGSRLAESGLLEKL